MFYHFDLFSPVSPDQGLPSDCWPQWSPSSQAEFGFSSLLLSSGAPTSPTSLQNCFTGILSFFPRFGLILLLLCIRHCRTLSLVFSPSLLLFFLLVVLLFFPVSVGFNLTSATAEFVHSYCLLLVLFLLLVIVGGGDCGFDFFVHSLYFGNFILPQSLQNFAHPINAWKIVLIYNQTNIQIFSYKGHFWRICISFDTCQVPAPAFNSTN